MLAPSRVSGATENSSRQQEKEKERKGEEGRKAFKVWITNFIFGNTMNVEGVLLGQWLAPLGSIYAMVA